MTFVSNFEYNVVQLNQEAGWSAQLTAIGAEGWELITIVHGPDVAGFAARDWHKQAMLAQHLKSIVTTANNDLEPHQMEAIEMICVKISRILTGDPNHADHWDDICGYARLGKQGHE